MAIRTIVVGLDGSETSYRAFAMATGLAVLHYALLLPPEQLCLQRVRDRVGHGFTDLDAASHMYKELADAEVDRRHVVASTEDAAAIAAHLADLSQDGALSWTRPSLSRGR